MTIARERNRIVAYIETFRHAKETQEEIDRLYPSPRAYCFILFRKDGTVVARRDRRGIWQQYIATNEQRAGISTGGQNPKAVGL